MGIETMTALKGSQKKYLRGLAHSAKPLVHVGQHGLSETVLAQIHEALDDHELVKVRYLTDDREEKAQWTAAIAEQLKAEAVGSVGHTAIFYRPQADPERRKIRVPQ
jgi:RNA-binding protein